MVTDQQVRLLFKLMHVSHTLATAAAKAGMDEKTARKYRRLGKLPGEIKKAHDWSGHEDAFADVWDDIRKMLGVSPGLEAKTLFRYLQRLHPGRFPDGQLRTLQRRIKTWRATEGPAQEVFFAQKYRPGERSQSDFTRMRPLGITIAHQAFDHLIYHFVLPYSDWETGTVCFSESFESLSEGLQNALFELGGTPRMHQTDSLTAAVSPVGSTERFTDRYRGLLRHYGIEGMHTNPSSPHENGDVEQRNRRFKDAVRQSLLLRGSSNFESREDYGRFLDQLFVELNRPRRGRLTEELAVLGALPTRRVDACRRLEVRVRQGSTISVYKNIYSVHSRLVGEKVDVHLFHDRLEVHYAQRKIDEMPRLRGTGKHAINYRHVIERLVRKPGAFADYLYKADLFPTHRFRMAYDVICRSTSSERAASKRYLDILHVAARENEAAVDGALAVMISRGECPEAGAVKGLVARGTERARPREIEIAPVELTLYDALLSAKQVPVAEART
jgi:transposase